MNYEQTKNKIRIIWDKVNKEFRQVEKLNLNEETSIYFSNNIKKLNIIESEGKIFSNEDSQGPAFFNTNSW